MLWLILSIFGLIFVMSLFKALLKKEEIYDPFALWLMWSRLECQNCKYVFERQHKRFEYINQTIELCAPCPNCKVKGKALILGIFYEHIKTPEEIKWEKEIEKWR